jgi:hypothetical protein
MPGENPSVRVWYDSQCPLCLREINLMRRLDSRGAIDFVDLYTARDCPVDRGELVERFHAQEAGQPAVSGAAAFAAMWRAIPVLRPLGHRPYSPGAVGARGRLPAVPAISPAPAAPGAPKAGVVARASKPGRRTKAPDRALLFPGTPDRTGRADMPGQIESRLENRTCSPTRTGGSALRADLH